MHPVAVMISQRARGEIGPKAVLRGDGAHHGAEHDRIVGGGQCVGVAEVDLVLARSALMVGALREDAHPLQRQANLTANVFALVLRGHVHVSRLIERFLRGLALLVELEEVEFHFRAEAERIALRRGFLRRRAQQRPAVPVKGCAVGADDVAEHVGHTAALGPPGQLLQRVGVGAQEEVGALVHIKAADGRGVERNAVFKGAGQLPGHDRHVALFTVNVAKGHADKFDVLLQNILHHFIRCVFHGMIAPSLSVP